MPFSVDDNVDDSVSLYAASKKANESMAHTYSHLYNLPTTGLRFFTVYIAAITPDVDPASDANQLTLQMLERLKTPFLVYQLDATAYPGNSGSPVFNRNNNQVVAIINKVFVSEGKESALTNPSGISYAIPVRDLRKLAKGNDIAL